MAGITAAELSELIAFDHLEPIGEIRADVRAATIASTIANVNRSSGSTPYGLYDFMPYVEAPKAKVLSAEEIEQELALRFNLA